MISPREPLNRQLRGWLLALGWVVLAFAAEVEISWAGSPTTPPASVAADSDTDPDRNRRELERELALAYSVAEPKKTGSRTFDLRAAPTSVQQFDGRMFDVWAYNDQVPGPILRVRLGEEVVVHLKNDLPQPTTIHWHGVRVPNAMDGVPGVTQEPIPPGETFTYRFVPKDAGTFWFHPHVRGAEQVERGLYGVLIVDDAKPLPYSRDEVWVLDDWRLGADGALDTRFVTRSDLAHDGRWGQIVTVNGDAAQLMAVRPGERIRPTAGQHVERACVPSGFWHAQARSHRGRWHVLAATIGHGWLRPGAGQPSRSGFDHPTRCRRADPKGHRSLHPTTLHGARLQVQGEPVETPSFTAPSNPEVPIWAAAAEQAVDFTYVLNAQRGGVHGIQWTINGRPWGEHEVTQLAEGRWVRVRFQNDSARLHPMHIHGQFFKVITRNGQPVDDAYFRDTVLLRRNEIIDVGMVPVDWGRWMMHCHILEHADAGMMTEIHVGER